MKLNSTKVVVVVEDDSSLRDELVLSLKLAGMAVFGAPDGVTLDRLMQAHDVDVVTLDLGLPGESGLTIAARLSKLSVPPGVVMLTGRDTLAAKLTGLAHGADAYLAKPADPLELIATIDAVRRRMAKSAVPVMTAATGADSGEVLDVSTWDIAFDARLLTAGQDASVKLSELQRMLLLCFKDVKPGKPVSRDKLMDALGYTQAESDEHRLETLISRLRQKARDKLGRDLPIRAVPGVGYALMCSVRFS